MHFGERVVARLDRIAAAGERARRVVGPRPDDRVVLDLAVRPVAAEDADAERVPDDVALDPARDELRELDWTGYRERYGDIHRLDRILEAEGDTPNRYKLSKQADVLMLFYLLSADELRELFERLGYELEPEAIPRIIDYYEARTSHGSTLSRVVHAWVVARSDRARSWDDVVRLLVLEHSSGRHFGLLDGDAEA